jgi:hypothetical protein
MGFPIVWTTNYQNKLMTGAIAAGSTSPGVLGTARCGLGQALITPNPATAWAVLDEGGYTGYAEPATIVWSALFNEVDGSQTALSPEQLFRCTGTSSVTMNNFFIGDGVGVSSTNIGSSSTGILGSGLITGGFPFVNTGDGFGLTIAWNSGLASLNCEATSSG